METCNYAAAPLPEQWILGQLAPAAAADFEAHLMTCVACQDAVESARGLRKGLALVAAQRAAQPARPARRWLAAAALLPLAAAALLLLRQQGDSAAARLEVARLETAAQEARTAGAREVAGREAAEARSQELESQLAASRAAAAAPARLEPLVDLPTFLLAALRDRPAGPDLRLERSRLGQAFNLALDLPDPSFTQFRVEVASGGRQLLERQGLERNALDALLLTLPADFLPSGESRIVLYGQGAGRPEQELARFRVAVD